MNTAALLVYVCALAGGGTELRDTPCVDRPRQGEPLQGTIREYPKVRLDRPLGPNQWPSSGWSAVGATTQFTAVVVLVTR